MMRIKTKANNRELLYATHIHHTHVDLNIKTGTEKPNYCRKKMIAKRLNTPKRKHTTI